MATTPAPAAAAAPAAKPKRRGGCLGCLTGCLLPILVIIAVIGAGFYFLVGRASATVSVPAQLDVIHASTTLTHNGTAAAAHSGFIVHENDTVSNDADGRSLIQFEDGSVTRIAPGSSVTLTSAQFDKAGHLAGVRMTQTQGRTYSTVQKLVGGAKFDIQGHSATVEVRGTNLEVITVNNATTLRVFVGTVHILGGGKDVTVNAGQQAVAAANGAIGPVTPIPPDPADPFTSWLASETAATGSGGQAGSTQESGGAIATGAAEDQGDYTGGGGDVVTTLSYPGSKFKLTVTDPAGNVHESDAAIDAPGGGKLVTVVVPGGAFGRYKRTVTAEQTDNNAKENYSVTSITKFTCASGSSDTGGAVRNVLSSTDAEQALVQAGGSNVAVNFSGAGNGGAVIAGSGTFSGTAVAGSAILYVGSNGTLSAQVLSVTLNGINITQQITEQLTSATGHNIQDLDVGYTLDRVYTCQGTGGTSFLVLEGHH